ncbi:heme biosynthesis HemY N-terminal domain-containing protein [Orbaceae bacterium ESL0721]|nr:heme biosynthesis HemY N-terminal domain-containing protein [Orbaceae bacterium ESL0721]
MFKLLTVFLILMGGLLIGPLIQGHQGMATFTFANYSIMMSFNTFIILEIIFLLLLYIIYWLLAKIFNSKTALGNWLRSKSPRKSAKRLEQAQLLLLEGNYQQAGKLFSQSAKGSNNRTLAYLMAAQAKLDDNQLISANQLLEQAATSCKSKERFAFQLVQIRLQIKNGEFAVARKSIDKLLADKPRNPEVLKLADQIYYEVGDYQSVIDILPIMEKVNIYSESQIEQFRRVAYIKRMQQLTDENVPDALSSWWLSQPKNIRNDKIYQKAITDCFEKLGETKDSQKILAQINRS